MVIFQLIDKTRILKLFICCCLLCKVFFNAKVCAQSNLIQGICLFKDDNKSLSNFEFKIFNTSIKCNSKGEFTYVALQNFIVISSTSDMYHSLNDTIYLGTNSGIIKLVWELKNKELDQIVVSAGRHEQNTKRLSVSTEIISPRLIENKVTSNIEKFMDLIPGVHITDGQANIRNGSGWSYGAGSRVMVLVDGLPFLSGDAGQSPWKFLPQEALEQVEVIKGASSVLYGSSALNGIINFRTKSAGAKPITQINCFSGVYDYPTNSGLNWSKTNRFQSGLSIFHAFKKGDWNSNINLNYIDDNGYRWGENDHRLRLGFQVRYKPQQIPGLQFSLASAAMISQSASFLIWESYTLGFICKDSLTTNTTAYNFHIDPSVSFIFNNWKHAIRSRYMYIRNDVQNPDPNVNQNNAGSSLYSEYQGQRSFNGKHLINIGLVWQLNFSHSPLYQGDHSSENKALYAQYDYTYKKLSLNGGVRYEWYKLEQREAQTPVFRAGLNYEATKSTFLRLGYGQGYRFPTIAESYILTSAGGVTIVPNASLQPEKSWSAEIGAKQAIQIQSLRLMLDACYYINQYDNMIEFNAGIFAKGPLDQDIFGFKSLNTGKTQVSGTEISIQGEYKFRKSVIRFMGGYTYSLPVSLEPQNVYAYDLNNNPVTYQNSVSDTLNENVLKYRYKHLFKWDIDWSWKKWNLGYSIKYNSYMQVIDRVFLSPIISGEGLMQARYDGRNGTYISDFRMSYQINSYIKLNMSVLNMFNIISMTRPDDLRAPRLILLQFQIRL